MAATKPIKQWEDLDFVAPAQAEALRQPQIAAQRFLIISAVFFVIAIVWAKYAALDEVTNGVGKVIASSQTQVVQNLEGGILKEILANEGQIVERDQILVRIDDTSFAASYGEARTQYFALIAAVMRLTAESEDKPLDFPPELVAERPDLAENERRTYLLRQDELQQQVSVVQQQVTQRESELLELRSKVGQLARSLQLAQEQFNMTAPLVRDGAVSRVDVLKLEREVNDLKGTLDTTRLAIPRAEAATREANSRIPEKVKTFRSEARRELTDRQTQLSRVSETINAAKDRVTRTEVRSPVRGTIKQIKIRTIGGVVRPGMDIVEIVPLEDTLLVEARVKPADIAFLRPGQDATVKVTAYDFSIYGGLKATLEHISADTITDEKGDSYYLICVRTAKNSLGSTEKPLPIIPGMTATVDILTGHKTVLDYIMKPILKAQERALKER